jgi:hypothetical protein
MIGHQGPGPARTSRSLRNIAALVLLSAAFLAPSTSRVDAAPSPANPAALIYAGWFGNTIPTPSFVSANLAFLESQPFDGLVVYLRNANLTVNLTSNVMKPTAISYDTMMSVLSPIATLNFTNLKHNLGLVQGSTPPDFFDDWSVVVQNYSNLAKAAKDSGLKGLCFDNEQYAAPWGNYASTLKYFSSKTKAEYETQARLRGKQIMEAMVAQFPDIVFMTLHGPYISEPDAPSALKFPQWQSSNELMGPFFAGHMEGAGTTGCCIDGGELYTLRSQEDFQASYTWRRYDLASDTVNSTFIPAALRTEWPNRSNISFGIYDKAFGGAAMDATILRPTLANAMRQADKYVWFYAEAATYLRPSDAGGASQTWVDAIRLARTDVADSAAVLAAEAAAAAEAPPAPVGPIAPTNLAATPVTPFDIDLSWTDNSADETGFQIERRTVNNGTWALVTTTQPDVTYRRDGSLWSGTGYVYRVRAVNASGDSAYASEVTATTPTVGDFLPAAPSNLNAVAASTTEIDVSWLDNSSSETGFQVERRTVVNGTWALVITVQEGATSYHDSSLAPSTGYIYRVRAVNSVGGSAFTAEVTATTQSMVLIPAAPSGLTAAAVSPFDIDLSWTDNSSDEEGFQVERRTVNNGTWALVATTQVGVTSLRNGGLWSATGYVYRVRAVNSAGSSSFTNDATATTPYVGQSTPATPSGLSATAVTSTEVDLRWTDNSLNEDGFKIERRRSGGSWTQVATVGAMVTTYRDTGRTSGITYVYRIRAYNSKGNSSYSGQARVTMPQ